jgi:hypothetical protein
MWCDHLRQVHENRVSGAKKRAQSAAAKRGTKKTAAQVPNENRGQPMADAQLASNEKDICFECGKENPPEAQDNNDDDDITWVCCDGCNNWCHAICSGILETDLSNLENCCVKVGTCRYLLVVKVGTCRYCIKARLHLQFLLRFQARFVHIHQKKIAPKIVAKIASVNGPLDN